MRCLHIIGLLLLLSPVFAYDQDWKKKQDKKEESDWKAYVESYNEYDARGHLAGFEYACGICHVIYNGTLQLLERKATEEQMMLVFRATCDVMKDDEAEKKALCRRVIDDIGESVIDAVSLGERDPKKVCEDLEVCGEKRRRQILEEAQVLAEVRKQKEKEKELVEKHKKKVKSKKEL
eukprot:Colp12_sorted_trinity150504_noHs@31437